MITDWKWDDVHQDHGRGRQLERALDHLAGIDRRVIDSAGLMLFVGDEMVSFIEKQDAKMLLALEAHGSAAIVDHTRP